jgi:hypothetical protein
MMRMSRVVGEEERRICKAQRVVGEEEEYVKRSVLWERKKSMQVGEVCANEQQVYISGVCDEGV